MSPCVAFSHVSSSCLRWGQQVVPPSRQTSFQCIHHFGLAYPMLIWSYSDASIRSDEERTTKERARDSTRRRRRTGIPSIPTEICLARVPFRGDETFPSRTSDNPPLDTNFPCRRDVDLPTLVNQPRYRNKGGACARCFRLRTASRINSWSSLEERKAEQSCLANRSLFGKAGRTTAMILQPFGARK